jgi:hypothetical protein
MQMPPTLFSHVTRCLYATEFARAVSEHPNKKPPRGLSAYDHFLALCFGQLTGRESLRDVVTCLNSRPDKLYHMGYPSDKKNDNRLGSQRTGKSA